MLRAMAGYSLAAACADGAVARALAAVTPPGADVAAVKGEAARAVGRALGLLGGMDRFVRPGNRVVVKPNIGFNRVPEQAANTNPLVVAEIVSLVLAAGAVEVLVFDRASDDPARCYRQSGIEAAVRGIADPRVRIFIPDPARTVTVAIPGGKRVTRWPFLADAMAADVFINCPVFKHHSMTGFSAGMKNIMGTIGGNRSEMHEGFDDKITDLNLARPSHLVVVDATRVLVRNGPVGGSLMDVRKVDLVVAGTDVLATDASACRLLGVDPAGVPHLRRAAERGIGVMDPGRIRMIEEVMK
jgi:uncharacterized protein (DUF362 family)